MSLPRSVTEVLGRGVAAFVVLDYVSTLEALPIRRGLDDLQKDRIAILRVCPPAADHVGGCFRDFRAMLIPRERTMYNGTEIKVRAMTMAVSGPF
jgi:hypothetical protein